MPIPLPSLPYISYVRLGDVFDQGKPGRCLAVARGTPVTSRRKGPAGADLGGVGYATALILARFKEPFYEDHEPLPDLSDRVFHRVFESGVLGHPPTPLSCHETMPERPFWPDGSRSGGHSRDENPVARMGQPRLPNAGPAHLSITGHQLRTNDGFGHIHENAARRSPRIFFSAAHRMRWRIRVLGTLAFTW